jgi:flagellar hook assembly protein FlgD
VTLTVFDASGRQMRSLWNGWQMAGGHTLAWDGRDDAARPVAAGVYFVRIETAGAADTQKLMLVR